VSSETLKEQLQLAREYVADHLVECCREELEWQDTALLCDGHLREAAKLFAALDPVRSLSMTQSEIHRQAMKFVVA
jgi:hypothetical protein